MTLNCIPGVWLDTWKVFCKPGPWTKFLSAFFHLITWIFSFYYLHKYEFKLSIKCFIKLICVFYLNLWFRFSLNFYTLKFKLLTKYFFFSYANVTLFYNLNKACRMQGSLYTQNNSGKFDIFESLKKLRLVWPFYKLKMTQEGLAFFLNSR